jgi:hypothetical protein
MTGKRWLSWRRLWGICKHLTAFWGLFSIVTAVCDFFPGLSDFAGALRTTSVATTLLLTSLTYAIILNRPRTHFRYAVCNRDCQIELRIGDLLDVPSSLIVPVNSHFDMVLGGSVKTSRSIQAAVIDRWFKGDVGKLKRLLDKQLLKAQYADRKTGDRYQLGTVVPVQINNNSRRLYFVANSNKINEERVEATKDGLYQTLPELWSWLATHGAKEAVAIPLLGTGHGRLSLTRQEVCKDIIRSFVAACADKVSCNCLTIVVADHDIQAYGIDIDELDDFLRLHSTYTDFQKVAPNTSPAINNPEPPALGGTPGVREIAEQQSPMRAG